MSKETAVNSATVKFALKGRPLNDEIELFLRERGIVRPVIISQAGKNGTSFANRWTGSELMEFGSITLESLSQKSGTGCLESFKDGTTKVIFLHNGKVEKTIGEEEVEKFESNVIQSKMDI